MDSERNFKLISYAAVFCGFLLLWVSGTFGLIETGFFVSVILSAWFLEGSRWQMTERVGTVLIVLALPAFYLIYRFQIISLYGSETAIAGILARMILSLTAIKLLQNKGDRDWIFLYLMAFFEVLLAAGLSISAFYLVSFLLYLVATVCAVIAFEIRKTSRSVKNKIAGVETGLKSAKAETNATFPVRRLPATAIVLIFFITLLATPLFFILPRVGGAGIGGGQGGLSTSAGFSDRVKLGGIGTIQQSDEVAMRVRVEGIAGEPEGLYLRGIALDTFDNQSWNKSKTTYKEPFVREDRELIQVDFSASRGSLLIQDIYLEPLDTPILFGLSRVVAVQGNFPLIYKDAYGAISYPRNYERISYKILSDRNRPSPADLREDNSVYGAEMSSYLQLPLVYDKRIYNLAYQIASKESNRYDKTVAIQKYLENNFGYTLEQKSGGSEPLADFLFNIREGHCEYFATAMTIMLRTQGIASRIVNGFHGGEYNNAVDMTIVRQRNAHSWVEVYFPKDNAWITFDPTPYSTRADTASAAGLTGQINKYVEALQAVWIQYFVAFDTQEQSSIVRSIRRGFIDYQSSTAAVLAGAEGIITEWWADIRGQNGWQAGVSAILYGAAYFLVSAFGIVLLVWTWRKVVKLRVWRRIWDRLFVRRHASIVEFYDRMQQILASKGLVRGPHQTPLEFAFAVNMPEAVRITEKYNRVRFGEKPLTSDEMVEIENWLKDVFATNYTNVTNQIKQ